MAKNQNVDETVNHERARSLVDYILGSYIPFKQLFGKKIELKQTIHTDAEQSAKENYDFNLTLTPKHMPEELTKKGIDNLVEAPLDMKEEVTVGYKVKANVADKISKSNMNRALSRQRKANYGELDALTKRTTDLNSRIKFLNSKDIAKTVRTYGREKAEELVYQTLTIIAEAANRMAADNQFDMNIDTGKAKSIMEKRMFVSNAVSQIMPLENILASISKDNAIYAGAFGEAGAEALPNQSINMLAYKGIEQKENLELLAKYLVTKATPSR